jgi:quinol monooxygenase YgiN
MTAMAEPYAMHVTFKAKPGKGDELAAILLEAAEGAEAAGGCVLYMVSRSDQEADAVWVTEAWTSREEHDASLEDEGAKALIERALPLLAGPPDATEMRPVGGKGL